MSTTVDRYRAVDARRKGYYTGLYGDKETENPYKPGAMVKVITCDGPLCVAECRGVIPVGWVTFVSTYNRHLCPRCATEVNIKHQVYYQAMERINKERGD